MAKRTNNETAELNDEQPKRDQTAALRKQVAPTLAKYPDVPWFRVAADGKVFLPYQSSAAERYAKRYNQPLSIIDNG